MYVHYCTLKIVLMLIQTWLSVILWKSNFFLIQKRQFLDRVEKELEKACKSPKIRQLETLRLISVFHFGLVSLVRLDNMFINISEMASTSISSTLKSPIKILSQIDNRFLIIVIKSHLYLFMHIYTDPLPSPPSFICKFELKMIFIIS